MLLLLLTPAAAAQQAPDTSFDVRVAQPAYTGTHPRVVIDEAHHNFHTASGRYQPFARLLGNDGYDVKPGTSRFTAQSLAGVRVLVISNALGEGATVGSDTSLPAFTQAECDAVLAWVRAGGSLLLISDHTPMGEANERLGRTFGVAMGKGFVAATNAAHHRPEAPSSLIFSRQNGLLQDHPITRGRGAAERVNTVISFTGQSLSVPAGAQVLLALGSDAWEAPTRQEAQAFVGDVRGMTNPATFTSAHAVRVNGRAQGLAMTVGGGRVVILGEAAMMSAQVSGPEGRGRMGMNVPGSDDKQFVLNILHWLSGLL
jgi:hypothetical protein